MKKIVSILLSIVLILGVLAGCNEQDPGNTTTQAPSGSQPVNPGEVKLTDGIFENTELGMKCFFKFKEDGCYYAYFFDGGAMEAGTYEVLSESKEYIASAGADGEFGTDDDEKATADTIIRIVSYAGSTQDMAYVDDEIRDASMAGMSNHKNFQHKADYVYDPATEEPQIPIVTLYADNKAGNSLTLYHDKTFLDYSGEVGVEGTWELIEGGYALTDEDGNTVNLTLEGTVGTYGDKTLSTEIIDESAPKLLSTFTAPQIQVGLPMAVDMRIETYTDGSCFAYVYVAAVDADLLVDQGTFEYDAAMNYTFHFATAGDVAGTPDYATATTSGIDLSIAYKADVTADFAGTATPMSIDTTLSGTASMAPAQEATLVSSVNVTGIQVGLPMAVDMHIDMFSDGTCKAFVYVAAVEADLLVDEGTYEVDATMKYTFHFGVAGDVAGTPDYATATTEGIDISVAYKAEVSAEFMGNVTPMSIDATLTGTVTGQ